MSLLLRISGYVSCILMRLCVYVYGYVYTTASDWCCKGWLWLWPTNALPARPLEGDESSGSSALGRALARATATQQRQSLRLRLYVGVYTFTSIRHQIDAFQFDHGITGCSIDMTPERVL